MFHEKIGSIQAGYFNANLFFSGHIIYFRQGCKFHFNCGCLKIYIVGLEEKIQTMPCAYVFWREYKEKLGNCITFCEIGKSCMELGINSPPRFCFTHYKLMKMKVSLIVMIKD